MTAVAKKFTIDIDDENGHIKLFHNSKQLDSVESSIDDVVAAFPEMVQPSSTNCNVIYNGKIHVGSVSISETDEAIVLNVRFQP